MTEDTAKEPTTNDLLRLILSRLDRIEERLDALDAAAIVERLTQLEEQQEAIHEKLDKLSDQIAALAKGQFDLTTDLQRYNRRITALEEKVA